MALQSHLAREEDFPREVKPGWKTTEFWLVAGSMAAFLLMLGLGRITPDEIERLWPMLVSAAGYAISRGMAK